MAFQVYFTSKYIPNRPQWIFYKKLIAFSFVTGVGCIICSVLFPIREYLVHNWILHALLYAFILGVLYLCLSLVLFRKEVRYFAKYIRRKT